MIVFLIVDASVNAAVFLLVLLVNRHASGLTAWMLPFWARGIASFAGAYAGVASLEALFADYPRRGVAITLFVIFGILIVFSLFGVLAADETWEDRTLDLTVFLGAIITILTVRAKLYPARKLSN